MFYMIKSWMYLLGKIDVDYINKNMKNLIVYTLFLR